MSLAKIADTPEWGKINKRVSARVADLQGSPVPETMKKLQAAQLTIQQRKTEIESMLLAMTTEKNNSAWQSALEGNDAALESRDRLRAEYAELEQRERFTQSAIEEGKLALDAMRGKVHLAICNDVRPDYLKAVVPKARAAARQMLEAIELEQRFVSELLRHDIRIDHLGRISFPTFLSCETLEAFLHETEDLV